jgi:hypothetical protein
MEIAEDLDVMEIAEDLTEQEITADLQGRKSPGISYCSTSWL